MKLTIVGSGDAFGSGGRSHTCFRLDADGLCVAVDFGASAIVGWKKLGFGANDVDAIVISHLHGDHFGGLPFLLLDCQFVARRKKPLVIAGPPGLRNRLEMAMEAFFPGAIANRWTFPWEVREVVPGEPVDLLGFHLETLEVIHPSGAPATGIRLTRNGKTFSYSGDTGWTPALDRIAANADVFMCECYSGSVAVPNHIDWPSLKAHLTQFTSKRLVLTHMNEDALSRANEIEALGVGLAHDGLVIDL